MTDRPWLNGPPPVSQDDDRPWLKGGPPEPSRGLQAAPVPSMRDYFAPPQPTSSTTVSTPVGRGAYENRIEERPLSLMESAKEVLGGLASGASFGLAEPDPQFSERPASQIAQFMGEFGPITGLASGARAALKPITKGITSTVGKWGTRAAESGLAGGAYSTIKQGVQGDVDPTEVGKEAGLWAGIDATLGSFGMLGKMIRKSVMNRDKDGVISLVNAGVKNGQIPEETATQIRTAVEKSGYGKTPEEPSWMPWETGPKKFEAPTTPTSGIVSTPQRNIRETITPAQAERNRMIENETLPSERTTNVGFQPGLIPNQRRFGTADVGPKMQVQANAPRFSTISETPKMQVGSIDRTVTNSRQVPTSAENISQPTPPIASAKGAGKRPPKYPADETPIYLDELSDAELRSFHERYGRGTGTFDEFRVAVKEGGIEMEHWPTDLKTDKYGPPTPPIKYETVGKRQVHPSAVKALDEAMASSDLNKLSNSVLHPDNKGLRQLFQERTGVKLPPTIKGSRDAIHEWILREKPEMRDAVRAELERTRPELVEAFDKKYSTPPPVPPVVPKVGTDLPKGGKQPWEMTRDAMPWEDLKHYGHRIESDGSITLKTMRAGGPGDASRGGVWHEVALRGDESLSTYGGEPGKTGTFAAKPVGVGGRQVTRGETTLKHPYVFDVSKIHNEAKQVIRLADDLFGNEQVKKWSRGLTGANAEKAFARIEREISARLSQDGYDGVLFYHDIAGAKYPDNIFKFSPDLAKKYGKGGSIQAQSLAGGVAGFEQDEQGNVGYDPVKGAIGLGVGLAGVYGANKFQKNQKPVLEATGPKKSPVVPEKAPTVSERTPAQPVTEYGRVEGVNLNNYNIESKAKQKIAQGIETLRPQLEKVKGGTMTNEEVIEAAKTVESLAGGITRQESLATEAALLRTRQHLAALSKSEKVTPEFIESLKVISEEATARGRALQKLSIDADPELSSFKVKVLKELTKIGAQTDDIVRAAQGVDFNDAKQVTDFYRQFVKPSTKELIDEYRYINLLSSPRTHIVNAFSNLTQATVVRPATRLASGVIDKVASTFKNDFQRQYYTRQVPAYFRGMSNSFGDATSGALGALKGTKLAERPDLAHIPTGSKFFEKTGMVYVPRMLEAGDVFFRTLVEGGEREALAYKAMRQGKQVNTEAIAREAQETAAETVFRKPLDPENKTGHGVLLAGIDKGTQAVYQLRKVPGVKWFIPFVQTPMNIFKQGIEYSPLGFGTLKGNTKKLEQVAKASVGSMVFAGAGWLAMDGRTTWAAPRGKKEKAEFYAAGLQPYSVKMGDKWVSYSKLGPLAYPIAMASAMRYYHEDSPNKLTEPELQKMTKTLGGIAEFFADQSYLEGMQNILEAVKAKESAMTEGVSSAVSQVIPLSALQRWVATMVDPIYRQTEKGLSAEAIIERLKTGIPGLSQQVDPYLDNQGNPSKRHAPFGNAFSPMSFRQEDSTAAAGYRQSVLDKQQENWDDKFLPKKPRKPNKPSKPERR